MSFIFIIFFFHKSLCTNYYMFMNTLIIYVIMVNEEKKFQFQFQNLKIKSFLCRVHEIFNLSYTDVLSCKLKNFKLYKQQQPKKFTFNFNSFHS